MRVEHINPFIEAVYEVFGTTLQAKVVRGRIGVSAGKGRPLDVMAIIGISGPTRGTVAFGFPAKTAMAIVSRLLGAQIAEIEVTVSDGLAQFINMVGGSAKAKLNTGNNRSADLSLPTVVLGEHYHVQYPSSSVWLEVPFAGDLGEFHLRVTYETSPE